MASVTDLMLADNATDVLLVNVEDESYFTLKREELIETIYTCVSIFGIPGNVLTLVAILTSSQMRVKPFNLLIVNQSIIDLCSCTIGLLVQHIKPEFEPGLKGQLICQLWSSMYFFWVFCTASSYNLTAIAVERYLAVANPLQYDTEKVLRRMPLVLMVVYLCGFMFLIPEAVTSYPVSRTECVLYYQVSYNTLVMINVLYCCVNPMIPLVIMVFAYSRIAQTLRRDSKNAVNSHSKGRVSLHKAQVHIIQTAGFLSALFLSCYTYLYVFQIGASFFGLPLYPQYHITVALIIVNSCINPYIYCIRYDEFQKRIKEIFYTLRK